MPLPPLPSGPLVSQPGFVTKTHEQLPVIDQTLSLLETTNKIMDITMSCYRFIHIIYFWKFDCHYQTKSNDRTDTLFPSLILWQQIIRISDFSRHSTEPYQPPCLILFHLYLSKICSKIVILRSAAVKWTWGCSIIPILQFVTKQISNKIPTLTWIKWTTVTFTPGMTGDFGNKFYKNCSQPFSENHHVEVPFHVNLNYVLEMFTGWPLWNISVGQWMIYLAALYTHIYTIVW